VVAEAGLEQRLGKNNQEIKLSAPVKGALSAAKTSLKQSQ